MFKFTNKFVYAAVAFFLTSGVLFKIPVLSATKELALIYPPASFPGEIKSWGLLIFRVSIGIIFIRHGYPKLTHLKQWSKSLKIPIPLCFFGAAVMFFGGFCLIAGFLTPLASLGILGSMAFALVLEVLGKKPFIARDPYLSPPGEYEGPKGKAEEPSYEKAFVYILIMLIFIVFGPGQF